MIQYITIHSVHDVCSKEHAKKLGNSNIRRSPLPLTSLKSPTSSWLAWHGGMVTNARCRKCMTQMTPPQDHPGDQYICPTQQCPGTWISGWESSKLKLSLEKSSSGSLSLEKQAVWRRRPTSPNHSPQPGTPTLEQLKALSGSLGISPAKGRWQVHCSHTSEAK